MRRTLVLLAAVIALGACTKQQVTDTAANTFAAYCRNHPGDCGSVNPDMTRPRP